jgi:hypothetical protein
VNRATVARWKVRSAMSWTEDAQRSLCRAMEQLSPVRFGLRQHQQLARLYELVKAEWYRLEKLSGDPRLDLDREPLSSELEAATPAPAQGGAL